jgi:hypothetical protein
LLPTIDKVLEEIDKQSRGNAEQYVETLAIQIHKQQELYTNRHRTPDLVVDNNDDYFPLSNQLQSSLRNGDIDAAVMAATKLQKEVEDLRAENKPVPLRYMNIYNINDALGRSAFLRNDLLSASDYLIRASAVDGGSPAMTTFGPDMWLAQALLKAGYRDVVDLYLRQCRNFWLNATLGQYIDALERGGTPDRSKNVFSNGRMIQGIRDVGKLR